MFIAVLNMKQMKLCCHSSPTLLKCPLIYLTFQLKRINKKLLKNIKQKNELLKN